MPLFIRRSSQKERMPAVVGGVVVVRFALLARERLSRPRTTTTMMMGFNSAAGARDLQQSGSRVFHLVHIYSLIFPFISGTRSFHCWLVAACSLYYEREPCNCTPHSAVMGGMRRSQRNKMLNTPTESICTLPGRIGDNTISLALLFLRRRAVHQLLLVLSSLLLRVQSLDKSQFY